MFPIIRHLDDLLPHIQHKPEISVKVAPNGCTVVCYAIATPTTFDDEWSRECRGITFSPDGTILARTLDKFFNVGEKEETQVHNIDWSKVARVLDKRDGSMIAAMVINDQVVCKTKKSFETSQAQSANAFINAHPLTYERFVRKCAELNLTPTFEWTSPNDRIVLKYNHDELVLLHIRDNVSGKYQSINQLARLFRIPVVEDFTPAIFNPQEFIEQAQTRELIEGWIVQFNDGHMVKLKTKWYIDLHHSVTFTRERDIAEMVANESVDDFKSYLSSIGESLDKVEAIEKRVTDTLYDLQYEVYEFHAKNRIDDRKAFVELAKPHKLFGLIMQQYSGKEPRFKDYFLKFYLPTYSLETV